ncbi:inter-alpha-trypsin inhibitor heavy chain H3-like [Colossoma macropomum]|uniref:inter-alpha-trypsin inhibitor heavy chain H3-like n=1 Tax=Colossoma macropomum TaxID=42526 RepID=UPI001864AA57|nr:inter-alpha-trypsin inhibitor heavy chain H3-like [Colossoma macropomum]
MCLNSFSWVWIIMAQATGIVTLFGFLLCCAAPSQTNKERDVDIYSFHINSTVTSRYAITVITSRVANRLNESKEVHFQVKIPKNAFISKFRMTIEGKTYDGVVKEKEVAQQQYSQAVSRGESAGMVSSVGRTLEEFKTSVTVAAFSKVTFELTYEELLQRQHGKYQLLINAQPMQPVADFKIDVYIEESPGISFLEVKGELNTNELVSAVTTSRAGDKAWVSFYPTREQQTKCDVCGENGLNGDLLIIYDAERPKPSGELKASDGYFVHYFAPTDIQRLPKNVVFVIDRSGSMSGRKIEQTRLAMLKILGDLAEDDYFGLIIFDSQVEVWKPELHQATERNLKRAKDFVRMIEVRGATDINAAVLKGVEMINKHPRERSASILILLTDGAPNTGVSDPTRIQANVKEATGGKFPLYCLGFGFDVNFGFLNKMALENNGLARRIYEDSDADLQLQGFYESVATPLLTDVQLNYAGAGNLTQTRFSHYYNGSEIVVAGQITDNSLDTFQTEIIAISKNSEVTYQYSMFRKGLAGVLPQRENSIQRLWAYLTVKQLLEKEVALTGQEKEAAREEALNLSLKYKFVTPLTSMVVTKPQGEDTQVAHKPKEGEKAKQRQHSPASDRRLNSRKSKCGGFGRAACRSFRHQGVMLLASSVSGSDPIHLSDGVFNSQVHRVSPKRRRTKAHARKSSPSAKARLRTSGLSSPPVKKPHVRKASQLPPSTATPPVNDVRFLMSAPGQPKPLCFDLPVASKLRLLMDPSSDFSMNGMLSSKGFRHIALHYKTDHYLVLSTSDIHYYDGLNNVTFLWGQKPTNHETDGVALILRNDEMDVTMGAMRVVFFRHKKDGEMFLWPAVQQQPKNVNIQGIFGKNNLKYEELQGSVIKIKDQEVKATWSTATDYRRSSAPVLGCWLVPYMFVLQGERVDAVSDTDLLS